MSIKDVTFETKCYEKDWEIILKTDWLQKAIEGCKYDFKEKIVYINNVNDENAVCRQAEQLVKRGVITKYVLVREYADRVLDFFNLNKEDFKGGYYYSIQELTGIYLCETKYLLHFSSDARIKKAFDWIDDAIEKMENSGEISVANPTWNNRYNEARAEAIKEDDSFYYGYGFSDQCYLIPVDRFKAPIYNEVNKESARYPKYGGELFEKRVDSWMRNNEMKRITSKKGSYIHKNHPKNQLLNKLYVALHKGAKTL